MSTAGFYGGSLVVSYSSGGAVSDQLFVPNNGSGPGQFGFDGVTVSFEGVAIRARTGGANGLDLTIDFTSAATPAIIELLIERLRYANHKHPQQSGPFSLTLQDGDGDRSISALTSA